MLISMPTGTSTILGVFQVIAFSRAVWRELHADIELRTTSGVAQVRTTCSSNILRPKFPSATKPFLSWTKSSRHQTIRMQTNFSRLAVMLAKSRDAADDGLDLLCRYQPGAFELTRRSSVTGTVEKVVMIEPDRRVIPAAVACVEVDDPVGRVEFVGRMREAGYHDDGNVGGPCQP